MKTKKIRKIQPMSAGKSMGIVYFFLSIIIIIPVSIFTFASSNVDEEMIFMLLLAPFIYGVLGFLMGILISALYNATFNLHNGVVFEVETDGDEILNIGK